MPQFSWIYAVVIGLEIIISNYHHKKVYTWKETITNFYMSLLNGGIDLLIRGLYFLILTFFFSFHFIEIQNQFFYWILLFIALDFQFYWMHRMEHFCRLFWAVHITHHSSEEMNLSVGFRASVFQPLYRFVFFIPVTLLGFNPIDILFMYSLMQFWTVFVHTDYIRRIPVLEYIFVTPSHHRVHHASNIKYLDKNMGMVLIIWDRFFKTFQPELSEKAYEPVRYGLVSPIENPNPFTIVFHEWINLKKDLFRKDITLGTKVRYLFNPPGWSHDGRSKTSKELREKLKDEVD